MMVRMRRERLQVSRIVGMGAVVLLASSCATEPGRWTGLGGAAGGALGAGLGALVGSQTGDPTTGLIMGGAAGSVAGAAAGNVFEAEETVLEEGRSVVRERDREIAERREQIAALRTRSAASDLNTESGYAEAPRRPLRSSVSSSSLATSAQELRAPSPSILSPDMEDVRPIYVERRPGGRPRWEPSTEQSSEPMQPEKQERKQVAEPKPIARRASSPLNEDVRDTKTARVESVVSREVRRDTTSSVRTAPVQAAPDRTSPVKIVAPVRKAPGVTKQGGEEEAVVRPAAPALKQSTAKVVKQEKEVRVVEAPVKPVRRESRVVSEERQPEPARTIRKGGQAESVSNLSAPVKPLSSKLAIPVRPAPGLLAKENASKERDSRTQGKLATALSVQAAAEGRGRPVTKPHSVEARVRAEPNGREKENARKAASQAAASSLKKELVALAKQPVSAQDKPMLAEQKQSSAEIGGAKQASGECAQASQEIDKSKQVSEPAEKLFHYRRALRLCPSEARYHVHLGDHYRSLKRDADANFEYKEALALDPSNSEVKEKVDELKNG